MASLLRDNSLMLLTRFPCDSLKHLRGSCGCRRRLMLMLSAEQIVSLSSMWLFRFICSWRSFLEGHRQLVRWCSCSMSCTQDGRGCGALEMRRHICNIFVVVVLVDYRLWRKQTSFQNGFTLRPFMVFDENRVSRIVLTDCCGKLISSCIKAIL